MPLSYVSGPSEEPLLGETIGDNFDRIARAHGDEWCLISRHEGIRLTYAGMAAEVDRCALGLLALGIGIGDRVGIWAPNRSEWAILQYAAAKVGAILVNVNPAYRTHEVAYVLEQSGCRMLVANAQFKTSDYVGMIGEVRGGVHELETVIFLDSDTGDLTWNALLAGGERTGIDQLAARQSSLQFDDPINIQYTSGTTGFPKGATLSHHNILNNAYHVTGLQHLGPGDALCIPVPLYHCFGMVMGNLGCTTRGATMVYPAPSFEPLATLEAVQAERCSSLYGVPTMFIAELAHPEFDRFDLSSLRTGVMAGSPCPVEVMKACVDRMHMTDVTICYGMTETSPVSTQTLPEDSLHHRTATVGRAHPHVEIRVADPESGETLPRGATGEFCTRGYSVMTGYWNDAERTADAIDADGWMHTGDLAVMDDDGYVNIVGRIKDMVIRGGENVYPREIEEFLYAHPDVEDVQVIGVPDERYGEELMAWVKVRPGATVDGEALRAFCTGRIAHFKVPRYVKLVDEFPMTVTGKVQKFKMREQAIAELGLDTAAATKMA